MSTQRTYLPIRENEIILRAMCQRDVIWAALLDHMVFPDPWGSDAFAQEVENRHAFYFVLEHLHPETLPAERRPLFSALLGVVGLREELARNGRHYGHITNLVIHPAWQGQGLGRRLLQQALITARRRTLAYLMLEVYTTNERAIALYESEGFTIEQKLPRYYSSGADAYLMTKPLPDGGPTEPAIAPCRRERERPSLFGEPHAAP